MKIGEAIQVIGTTTPDVKGVPKRFPPIVRRPDQPGYTADIGPAKKRKKKRKKDDEDEEEKEKNEGRRITRDDRPMFSGQWDKGFWAKGKEKYIEPEDVKDEEDEEELKELLMQLAGGRDHAYMSSFWDKGRKYDRDGNEIEPDEGEEDPEKKDDTTDEAYYAKSSQTIGVTSWTDPNFTSKAQDPFWRKGNQYIEPDDEDDEEDEEDDD
jgi:hypothetical protein